MTFIIGSDGRCPDGVADAARQMRGLADDLTRFSGSFWPTEVELADAPILNHWSGWMLEVPCLAGLVTGHPLARGPRVRTSPLWALHPSGRWARTETRFYRLGDPLASFAANANRAIN